MTGRPLPVPDEVSAPYWEAAGRGELVLARCSRCQAFAHPPEPVCPECGHTDPVFEWVPVDGPGVVRSWTVVRRSFLPGFEVPFVLVDVELAGVRLIGRLVDGPDAPLAVGDPVEVTFDDGVPAFRRP